MNKMNKRKKIAVAALIRGYNDLNSYDMLINRNKHIKDNFLPKLKDHQCDVVIYHEGNVNDDHQRYIIEQSDGMDIQFIDIGDFRSQFTVGYWFMCRFWSLEVLKYLSDYNFVVRIDDDCDIMHINEEELNYVINSDVNYATAAMIDMRMELPYRRSMHEQFLNNYCKDNDIVMKKAFNDIVVAYPNFMITNIQYYRNNQAAQHFLHAITANNTIENMEIGDSNVWGMIFDIIDGKDYYVIKDMKYNHHSHKKIIYGGVHLEYGGMVPEWPSGDFSYSHPYYNNL